MGVRCCCGDLGDRGNPEVWIQTSSDPLPAASNPKQPYVLTIIQTHDLLLKFLLTHEPSSERPLYRTSKLNEGFFSVRYYCLGLWIRSPLARVSPDPPSNTVPPVWTALSCRQKTQPFSSVNFVDIECIGVRRICTPSALWRPTKHPAKPNIVICHEASSMVRISTWRS